VATDTKETRFHWCETGRKANAMIRMRRSTHVAFVLACVLYRIPVERWKINAKPSRWTCSCHPPLKGGEDQGWTV
jgi:hypothetical protein